MKKLVIKIEELPARAYKLSPEDYEKVFGGECIQQHYSCATAKEVCCDGFECRLHIATRGSAMFCN